MTVNQPLLSLLHPSICFLIRSSDPPSILLLSIYSLGVHIDYNVDRISYDDFINRELILFSHAGASLSLINLQYSASCNINLILSLHYPALHCTSLSHSPSKCLSLSFVPFTDQLQSPFCHVSLSFPLPDSSFYPPHQTMSGLCLTSWMA